jgi:hypothetical protein
VGVDREVDESLLELASIELDDHRPLRDLHPDLDGRPEEPADERNEACDDGPNVDGPDRRICREGEREELPSEVGPAFNHPGDGLGIGAEVGDVASA